MSALASKDHVEACLVGLIAATGKVFASAEVQVATMGLFTGKLVNFPPSVVTAACQEAGERYDRWPTLALLLKLCRGHAERERIKAKVETPIDLGSVLRNEVLLMLGEYGWRLRDACRDEPEYAAILDHVGGLWAKIRPEGGYPVLERIRGYGTIYHRAVQAVLFECMRWPPLHPAYVNKRAAEKFWEMTGRQIPVGVPTDGADA